MQIQHAGRSPFPSARVISTRHHGGGCGTTAVPTTAKFACIHPPVMGTLPRAAGWRAAVLLVALAFSTASLSIAQLTTPNDDDNDADPGNWTGRFAETTFDADQEMAGDICYLMEYGPAEDLRHILVHPVSEFPASHALVQNVVCGQKFQAGDPIPAAVRCWLRQNPPTSVLLLRQTRAHYGGGHTRARAHSYPRVHPRIVSLTPQSSAPPHTVATRSLSPCSCVSACQPQPPCPRSGSYPASALCVLAWFWVHAGLLEQRWLGQRRCV